MNEGTAASATPASGPASGRGPTALRWIGATAVAWLFVDAAFTRRGPAGISTFGDPPELAVLWLACAAGWAAAVSRANDRLAVARRLLLALLVATLLGRRLVPAEPGLRLALLGVTLWAAAPWLRPRAGTRATLLVLLLALPALLLTKFPQGSLLWFEYALPAAALALLLPAICPGRAAHRAGAMLVLATAAGCVAALGTYVSLARGLQLPLANVALTRLHLLGIHPNLAVPHLMTTLVLGVSLLPGAGRAMRWVLGAALGATLLALLALQSRTGLLVVAFGLGTLLLLSRRGWWPMALHRLAIVGVAALLLFPLTGLSSSSIARSSSSLVSKAVSFRSAMWELGADTLAAAPWNGFGPGRFYVQARYARSSRYDGLPKDDHPHNVLLATGEALGWPGLLGLLVLFAASVRRPRSGGALAAASAAAALALWAADAVDLGGADATLYPSLAFLLLGLRHAAGLPDDPGRGAPAGALARRVATVSAAVLALAGLLFLAAAACKQHALEQVDAAVKDPALQPQAAEALAQAARLAPLDPELPLQSARLAQAAGQHDAAVDAVRRALALYPENAELTHQLALSMAAAFDQTDPRVDALLQEAIALDPHGPGAARRLRERAYIRALLNDREAAFDALLAAILLDPSSVAGMSTSEAGDEIFLLPGGPGFVSIPLSEVRDVLARRRAELASADPPSETRLRMRDIEMLRALALWDRADAATRKLLAGDRVYLARQLAQTALARGAYKTARDVATEGGGPPNFWSATDTVEAIAKSSELTAGDWDAALATALAMQARDVDIVFELPTVKRLLEAQRAWAERQGDALAASRFADALEYASR